MASPDQKRPPYWRVFSTFARNSLIREMSFRGNFLLQAFSSFSWVFLYLIYYLIIFNHVSVIGPESGWGKYQFFVFLSTTLLINSVVQAFFMPNINEFSELIRTGGLDFALLKPIDLQFLISLQKIEWPTLTNFVFGLGLLIFSISQMDYWPAPIQILLYPLYVGCGIAIFYSLMIVVASLTVYFGRNQSLYDVWFYITVFSRYPMEIYQGRFGAPLRVGLTYVLPVLAAVNVPAALLAKPLEAQHWPLAVFTLFATAASLWGSRLVFNSAVQNYRSASS